MHVCVYDVHGLSLCVCKSQKMSGIFLRQDLSLNLKLGWQPESLNGLPVSILYSAGVTGSHGQPSLLCACWEPKPRSSRFLTLGATSPAQYQNKEMEYPCSVEDCVDGMLVRTEKESNRLSQAQGCCRTPRIFSSLWSFSRVYSHLRAEPKQGSPNRRKARSDHTASPRTSHHSVYENMFNPILSQEFKLKQESSRVLLISDRP